MSEWTDGRVKSFITSVLRGGYRRWPPKYECLKNAFVGKQTNKKTNRPSAHYLCASCKGEFPTSDVNVDHIDPVVGEEGFISWDKFITNLYCPIENLQVLCTDCHDKKTQSENTTRKIINANRKANSKRK